MKRPVERTKLLSCKATLINKNKKLYIHINKCVICQWVTLNTLTMVTAVYKAITSLRSTPPNGLTMVTSG
jgi:hypothetical protein